VAPERKRTKISEEGPSERIQSELKKEGCAMGKARAGGDQRSQRLTGHELMEESRRMRLKRENIFASKRRRGTVGVDERKLITHAGYENKFRSNELSRGG